MTATSSLKNAAAEGSEFAEKYSIYGSAEGRLFFQMH